MMRGEPRRIEQALLEVELPGAVLLRHQAALQPVGEPRDHALEMGELLVEIAAQPVELLGLAQIFGGDGLVELGGEGPVIGTARLVAAALARPPRLGGILRIAHLGIVRHVGGRRIGRLGGAVGQVLGRGVRLFEAHALAVLGLRGFAVLALLVLAAFLVVVLAVLLVLVAALVAHVEGIEQVVDDVAELALVLDHVLEPVEVAPGAALDEAAPQLDEAARRRRRRLAGQALAHQHRQRLLDRRIGAIGDLVEFAAMELVVEHGGEILGDALHAARPDRLDAGLLDRLEHRARLLAARQQAAVNGVVVAGHAQRDRVGMAAHDRGIGRRELARRLRQPRLAARHAGPFGRERDLKLGLARDRAQAAGHRALERLGRGFLGRGLGFDVRGHATVVIRGTLFTE